MTQAVASLYTVLGVAPTASQTELVAAHRRLCFEVMSGKLGLGREACDARLQELDAALATLSDHAARRLHDQQLFATPPGQSVVPAAATALQPIDEQRALQLAATAEVIHQMSLAAASERRAPFAAVAAPFGSSVRALTVILRILVLLFVAFFVFRAGGCVLASRKAVPPPAAVARAEEMLMIQDYHRRHGIRAANRAEVEAMIAADKRRDNERRAEEFNERMARDEMARYSREVSETLRQQEEEAAALERLREGKGDVWGRPADYPSGISAPAARPYAAPAPLPR